MVSRLVLFPFALAGLLLAACTAPEKPDAVTPAAAMKDTWRFESAAPDLRTTSCPAGTAREEAQPLALQVTPVTPGS